MVSANQISGFTGTSTLGAGIWTSNTYNMQLSENNIFGGMPAQGILVNNPNCDTTNARTNANRIFNNVINGEQGINLSSITTLAPQLIHITGSFNATANPPNPRDAVEVKNNTVYYKLNTTTTSTTTGALYITGGTPTSRVWAHIGVRNNHFQIDPLTGNLPSALRLVRYANGSQLDSLVATTNNFRFGGSTLPALIRTNADPAADHATVVAWRTATGKDSASLGVAPVFLSPNVLIPSSVALDNKAVPVSYISSDIQGLPRSTTTPDIGAYEFNSAIFSQISPNLLGDTLLGPSRQVTVSITDSISTLVAGTARMFYKKTSQATWQIDSLPAIAGNSYTFLINYTALGGVSQMDAIEYYFAVLNATGTVTTSPLGGDGLYQSNAAVPFSVHRYLILPVVSGVYRIGVSGPADFPTLTAAHAFFNNGLVNGPTTFVLIDTLYSSSETFPLVFSMRPGMSAVNSLRIRPDSALNTVRIEGASGTNAAIFDFTGAQFIHLGGLQGQRIHVVNNGTATNSAVIAVRSALGQVSRNLQFSNLSLMGGNTITNSIFGFVAGGLSISTSTQGDSLANIVLENIEVKRAWYGIYLRGSLANPGQQLTISHCDIGAVNSTEQVVFRGIDVQHFRNVLIADNHIHDMVATDFVNNAGIEIGGTQTDGVRILRNRINKVQSINTSGYGAYGINLIAGNNITIANNLIYDIGTLNYSNTSTTWNAFGIRITGGSNVQMYYNSIYMYGQYTNSNTTAAAAGLGVTITNLTGAFVNNIVGVNYTSNASGFKHFSALWFPTSFNFGGFTINNNAYQVNNNADHMVGRIGATSNSGLFGDVDAWKPISSVGNASNDQQSVPPVGKILPPFTSMTDLRIPANTPTQIESGGVVILVLDTPNTDYLGVVRPAGTGTAPDMGAFEFEGLAGADIFAPVIDSFAISPATNQCVPTARIVTVFARDNIGGSGIDSVLLSYQINGIAATPILLNRTAGTALAGTWSGTLPAAPAAAQRLVARVIASDSANNQMSAGLLLGGWVDGYLAPNAGADTTIVAGDTATLRGVGGANLVTIGTGNIVNTNTSYPAPYGNYWWGARHQFLITAAEMQAAGAAAGPISSLAFDVVSPQGVALTNFEIKLKASNINAMTTTESGLTTVFSVSTYTEISGWNTHMFTTPFFWNGTDNLVVEVCFNNSSYTNNAIVNQSMTSFVSSLWYREDAAGVCSNTGITGTASQRPNMRIGSSFQSHWINLSTGAIVVSNATVARVAPTVTTQYAYELFDSNCSKRDTMTVFVSPNVVNDLGVVAILSPLNVPALNQPQTVKVVIQNFGNQVVTGFDLGYRLAGGAEINANAVARTLAPGDTLHHTFSQSWTAVTGGNIRLCAYTKWVPDTNFANDTACITYQAVSVHNTEDIVGNVYPNPANQFVKFDFATHNGMATLEIRDNLGRILHREAVDLSAASYYQLGTEAYAAGLYHYRIVLRNQVHQGQFIIKR
ncbi:MAG: T9SS type A sorting domain-containing protein [Bacteroidia bacterium]